VIARYAVSANPDVADAGSGETLLSVAQPGTDHYGGTIAFSPLDGYLYFALGDGGTGPYDPLENAQDPQELLGKMLRLDVSGGTGTSYTIPSDNPFVGDPGVLDEIWAFGLRNPFRFSFDRLNGELWIGDVGQEAKEEIDREAAGDGGRNYGWDVMEGTLCNPFDPWPPPPACNAPALTLPFHEYDHTSDPFCSGNAIGGYVYRGLLGPAFYGLYFFGDFCTSQIWTLDPATVGVVERTADLSPATGGGTIDQIVGFGEDGSGELYVVDYDGEIFRIFMPFPVPSSSPAGLALLAALAGGVAGFALRRRAS
jgi:glucose/arabinose dehydrogenase